MQERNCNHRNAPLAICLFTSLRYQHLPTSEQTSLNLSNYLLECEDVLKKLLYRILLSYLEPIVI